MKKITLLIAILVGCLGGCSERDSGTEAQRGAVVIEEPATQPLATPRVGNGQGPQPIMGWATATFEEVSKFLGDGGTLDVPGVRGSALFQVAEQNPHVEVTRILLDHGADVNEDFGSGIKPLMLASASNKNPGVVAALLDAGADVEAQDIFRQTALHYAARAGKPESARLLLGSGAQTTAKDIRENTPLHLAVAGGDSELVQVFLDAGADLDARNSPKWGGYTPLHLAVRDDVNVRVIALLLQSGAGVDSVGARGITPLHLAYSKGNQEVISLLIEAGADENARDVEGRNPQQRAVYLEQRSKQAEEFCRLCSSPDSTAAQLQEFLDRGLDVRHCGCSPLHRAARNASDPEVILVLVKAGADLEELAGLFETPLHVAACHNPRPEITAALLEAGADLEAGNTFGGTPLRKAIHFNQRPEVISVLLEAGANVEEKGNDGATPLHDAAWRGKNPEVISMLLKAGADANAMTAGGQRPLDLARKNKALQGTEALKALEAATNQ